MNSMEDHFLPTVYALRGNVYQTMFWIRSAYGVPVWATFSKVDMNDFFSSSVKFWEDNLTR